VQTSGPVPRPVFLGFPAPAREAMAPVGFVPGGLKDSLERWLRLRARRLTLMLLIWIWMGSLLVFHS